MNLAFRRHIGGSFSGGGGDLGRSLLAHDLGQRATASDSLGLEGSQISERAECRQHSIQRIGTPERLREDIANARCFDYRSNGASGDNTGAGGGRLKQYLGGGKIMAHHEWNRGSNQRHLNEVFLGILDALLDGIGNFAGLAQTHADMAGSISDYYQRAIAKAAASLDYLRDAGNLDNGLFQVEPVCVNFWHILPRAPV